MSPHPTSDELVAFFSGKLPDERSREVDAHLNTCEACHALTDKRPPVPVLPRRASPHPVVPEGYKFVEELGRGGMGVVYLATRLSDGAQVVIKTLLPDHRGNSKLAGYLEREAALTAKVHSIRVLSGAQLRPFSSTDPTPYIEFPWVPSTPMGKMIGTPLAFESIPRLVGWVIQCCRALEAAHQRSPAIVHFDLKPENVLIQNQDSEAVLIDFGLACEWPPSDGETRTRCGTYEYMAPEVADPGRASLIGTHTDVFALGGMLCAILTGKPPYARSDFHTSKDLLQAASKANLRPAFDRLDTCHGYPELVAFTKRCLSVEPSNRPRDALAVRVELERLFRPRSSRDRWVLWGAAIASFFALALIVVQQLRPNRETVNTPQDPTGGRPITEKEVREILTKVRQARDEARTWLEDAKEAGTATKPKWLEVARKAGTFEKRMAVRKRWDDFANRLEDYLRTLEKVEQQLNALLGQAGNHNLENPPAVPALPAHPPLVEVVGWRHGAYGSFVPRGGGKLTTGIQGSGGTWEDIVFSYPLVELPVPRRVKSLQLRRQKAGGRLEDMTEVIEGDSLMIVAEWGGTLPTGEPLGGDYPECRHVPVADDPKTKKLMTTGGNPFDKAPSEGHPLRWNAGKWVDAATTRKRVEEHREDLARWEYSWAVTYADGNRGTISLKDHGPATAKP